MREETTCCRMPEWLSTTRTVVLSNATMTINTKSNYTRRSAPKCWFSGEVLLYPRVALPLTTCVLFILRWEESSTNSRKESIATKRVQRTRRESQSGRVGTEVLIWVYQSLFRWRKSHDFDFYSYYLALTARKHIKEFQLHIKESQLLTYQNHCHWSEQLPGPHFFNLCTAPSDNYSTLSNFTHTTGS